MLYRQLGQGQKIVPLGEAVWGDTSVMLPPELAGGSLENLFTGATLRPEAMERPFLRAAQLFESWPLALLAEKATSGED
jgi:maltooligosyltrehalose synthase